MVQWVRQLLQDLWSDFYPWDLHGRRRELTLRVCPLTIVAYMYDVNTHTHTHSNHTNFKILKKYIVRSNLHQLGGCGGLVVFFTVLSDSLTLLILKHKIWC